MNGLYRTSWEPDPQIRAMVVVVTRRSGSAPSWNAPWLCWRGGLNSVDEDTATGVIINVG